MAHGPSRIPVALSLVENIWPAHGATALRRRGFVRAVVAYTTVAMLANLVWETAQLPLYTIGQTGNRREALIALLHCTAGDVLIGAGALALGLGSARLAGWPSFGLRMAAIVTLSGVAYTIFSEWLNVEIRRSWAYAPAMPLLPRSAQGSRPSCNGWSCRPWQSLWPDVLLGGGGKPVRPEALLLNRRPCYPAWALRKTRERRPRLRSMRFLTLRCLVLLLSLALISGNAHAELHLGAPPHEPCPAELGHHHKGSGDHRHDGDHACCCDCLGCVSAIELKPDLTSFRLAFFTAAVFYGATGPFLAGQVLRPDPGPPRTGALS